VTDAIFNQRKLFLDREKKLIDVSGEEAIPCKIAMPIMVALY